MFARTPRLTLRPGWIEDAPELARAIGHWDVCANLSRVPWPYALGDAEAFLASQQQAGHPTMLIQQHAGTAVRLIGVIGIHDDEDGNAELGYWLTPSAWGKGFATEAGQAVVRMARDSLRLKRLVSRHFVDNPASGRVLHKLGFRPTGRTVPAYSRARGHHAPSASFALDLDAAMAGDDPRTRMAA